MDTIEQLKSLPTTIDQKHFEIFEEDVQSVEVLKISTLEKFWLRLSKWCAPRRFQPHFGAILERTTEHEAIRLSIEALRKPTDK